MSIVFQDGFDYMQDSVGDWATIPASRYQLKPEWQCHPTLGGTINNFNSPGAYGAGRYANQVYRMGITVPQRSTYIAGFHFYPNTSSGGSSTLAVAFMRNGNVQCGLGWDYNSLTCSVWHGPGTTNLGTLAGAFPPLRWYHLEVKATVGASGAFTVNVDGIQALALTGINTQTQSDALIDQVMFQYHYGSGPDSAYCYDNVVILNTDGSLNNDMLGETMVRCYYPSGAGSSTNFTPNPGTNANWQNVKETNPDMDATYNASNTVNAEDLFLISGPSIGSNIRSADVIALARRDDIGLRTGITVANIGGTDYGATDTALFYLYTNVHQLLEVNPGTSAQWTVTDFSSAQFGYKVQT